MTLESIVRKPQQELKAALITELRQMGYATITRKGFTYGAGSIPVLLVAHLDTVHKEPVQTICYSADQKVLMSPQGIGGDDRAGVYMIQQIIRQHRCHVLFCEDEEIGGVGAHLFAESHIRPEVNYIVELDRRGSNDAVFYDCANPEFIDFVSSFGFQEELGSFSDISIIAPELGVAAVNLSAGYYNEHTLHEYVDMNAVHQNIQRVSNMITTPSEKFEYIEAYYPIRGGLWDDWSWCPYSSRGSIQKLKQATKQFGIEETEINLLLELGYYPEDIELMLNSPHELRTAICEEFGGAR